MNGLTVFLIGLFVIVVIFAWYCVKIKYVIPIKYVKCDINSIKAEQCRMLFKNRKTKLRSDIENGKLVCFSNNKIIIKLLDKEI